MSDTVASDGEEGGRVWGSGQQPGVSGRSCFPRLPRGSGRRLGAGLPGLRAVGSWVSCQAGQVAGERLRRRPVSR